MMNRFRKNKKEKAKEEVEVPESSQSSFTAKLTKKGKKEEPEPTPELDLSTALPSSDDFRTSLIMPKLSARFSMLREQDDPASIIGKASDDSVLFPRRASRLNIFGHNPNLLSDIDEVSINESRPSVALGRTDSYASGGDGYGTDDDRSQQGSIMSRARRTEGNNLFGGRQKVYKIPNKATSSEVSLDSGRTATGGRVVYEHDLTTSAFQRQRSGERLRLDPANEESLQDAQGQESEDALSSASAKRTTFSSTASGPTANGRTSTAATSFDEPSFAGPLHQTLSGSVGEEKTPASKPPYSGMASERSSVKSRRLYGQGLAQSAQNQQNSTLHRLESLSRQRAGTPEMPPLNRSYSRSATNLRERLQKLAIADPAGGIAQPASPLSLAASPIPEPKERKSPTASGYGAPPLSPPASEKEEGSAIRASVQPEDHGKATAMGYFNKPRTPYDDSQFTRRQLQMHQGRDTPSTGRATPQEPTGRSRGPSFASQRSRAGSASSHYSEIQPPVGRSAAASTNASPPRQEHTTFLSNSSPSDSDNEGDAIVEEMADYNDLVHPAFRSETPTKPSTPEEQKNPLPEVRYSDLGDLKPIAENEDAEGSPDHGDTIPEKPDSPTLGPSGLGLSGLVRTHLRRDSDKSSIYRPPSPVSAPKTAGGDTLPDASIKRFDLGESALQPATPNSSIEPRGGPHSSWESEMMRRHRREASTETQREREEFAIELAERRRKVQEKLKGFAENESRSASPVSGRQTPDHGPGRPGNAFALLKNKTGKHNLFGRPDPRNPKVLGLGNASTPALVSDELWREEEERPSFNLGKHSNSSSPHIAPDKSVRSRMAALGRTSQEDSRESSRSRAASPHSSLRSQRDRSSSDASGRSKSRTRRDRDDLGTVEEIIPPGPPAFHDFEQRSMASVPSSNRPSVEVNEPPMYERAPSAASGRFRSGSRSATPSIPDRPLHPPPSVPPSMIGNSPRPSPIAPYSANATPPLQDASPDPSITPAATFPAAVPQRAPGHGHLPKRPINKTQISEPTFVSCTSNVPTVGLPAGASLSNGMETPPIPPMNPRRRRQTTTQTILGAIKGEKHESHYAASTASTPMDEHSTFSDEGERRPKSRHNRLRKTSSEGGNLNARARQQQALSETPPAVPAYPPPPVPMEGGMF
ncbi:hypothetical protein P170DRAFT_204996 [Aspergillus steynii IBT 23096]|uniref:Uncharacterized protein n=1 Tax=Aspergillus steynii IBT 23096 TaxID=1392250 RepID=A0A2I2G5B3_9EURO|nr:uncharacterized protein P170DRAFT_204996 [Aspergillus steynii IBT 23096]PLB48068.1 hypothetical protein P170DRAFT_204996 [Aspergillus steynii IBT 23096]